MHRRRGLRRWVSWFPIAFLAFLSDRAALRAHCDALDGPVVTEARRALRAADVTPVLKWVRPADEPAVRAQFIRAEAVRKLGPEAQALADESFFETVVRLHRAGEGAPYAGLKPPGSIDPGIAMADAALEKASVEDLARSLTREIENGLRERFARVLQARSRSGDSVSAGRTYVEAYVAFVHYVERLAAAPAGSEDHAGRHP